MKDKFSLIETLDQVFKMMRLATLLVVLLFILLFAMSAGAQAASIENLFMVPMVQSNGAGAVVFQPQTGAGLTGSNLNTNKNAVGLPNSYTPILPNFPPQNYNPFAPGSAEGDILGNNSPAVSSSLEAKLNIINDMPSSLAGNFGTLATTFTFIAEAQSEIFGQNSLMYRFDFSDGKPDSYFSKTNQITHRFDQPGTYQITAEILDQNGKITKAFNTVTVVADQPPTATFAASDVTVPRGTIIRFDSSYSTDNQYESGNLKYRFDWDGDGNFDTDFENRVSWFHLYNQPGKYFVVMEAIDPEGLTSRSGINISIEDNNAPLAALNIEKISDQQYLLDASNSNDDHSSLKNLKFRWDFNYQGANDIVFDTGFSNSPKQTVSFKLGGEHWVRVEVKDESGLVSDAVIDVVVPWNWSNLNLSQAF